LFINNALPISLSFSRHNDDLLKKESMTNSENYWYVGLIRRLRITHILERLASAIRGANSKTVRRER